MEHLDDEKVLQQFYHVMQSMSKLFRMEKSVMMDLATSRNCVIVGRCSDYVLRKYGIPDENMLNVFIYSPIEKRLSNCKAELNLDDPGEAYTYLTKVDKAREDFYKHYTKQIQMLSLSILALVMNTA